MNGSSRRASLLAMLTASLFAVFLLSLMLGRYPSPGITGFSTLREDPLAMRILVSIRLPRCLSAVLLGAALGAGGLVFQLIFSNPLVEPGFLGISQGAAFGAGICILAGARSIIAMHAAACFFGLAGLGLSYLLARKLRFGGWLLRLVLAGIAVSALFSAGLGLIKTAADPLTQLPELTFWLLGGLSGVTAKQIKLAVIPVMAPLGLLLIMRWRINLLASGDEAAFSLGIRPAAARSAVLLLAVIPVTTMISMSGIVQWAGLIVPHISRRLFGADATWSLPGSMVTGSLFCLICDDLARLLFPGEIPLGILTALTGVILFIIILTRPETEQTC